MHCPWCSNPEGMSMGGSERQEYEVDALLDETVRSKMMFFDGGGVTLTGGECSMQFEAVGEFLVKAKAAGIHTSIETNASHPRLADLFPFVDYLIMDLKHHDAEKHLAYTGVALEPVIRNISTALRLHPAPNIRIPLINGYNADASDIDAFIGLIKKMAYQNAVFELLRYHEYGKDKWIRSGRSYSVINGHLTGEAFALAVKAFEQAGLRLIDS